MPPDCEKDCDFQPRTISFCPWIMSLAVFLTNSILLDMLISFLWNKCWIFFYWYVYTFFSFILLLYNLNRICYYVILRDIVVKCFVLFVFCIFCSMRPLVLLIITLKIIMISINTLNCAGIRGAPRRSVLCEEWKRMKVDVLFLQETHVACVKEGQTVEKEFGCKAFWSFGTGNARGVGILLAHHLVYNIVKFNYDFDGRLFAIDIDMFNLNFRLINIYAPNHYSDRIDFLSSLESYLVTRRHVVLAGDFNFVMSTSLDKIGGDPKAGTGGATIMKSFLQNYRLTDPFRALYPNKVVTTWRGGKVSCRLDRFYLSADLMPMIKSCEVKPCSISDHDYCVLTVDQFDVVSVGSGYWKFNNSLLEDKAFVLQFRNFWESLDVNNALSLSEWDSLKSKLKEFILAYSKRVALEKNTLIYQLQRRYRQLIDAEAQRPGEYADQIKAIKSQLYNLNFDRVKGSVVRSRVQLLENNEQPSKFFLQSEFKNSADKIIRKLEDGNLIYDII